MSDSLFYTEEQPVPRKMVAFIFGGISCASAIVCIIFLLLANYIAAVPFAVLAIIFVLLLRWMYSVRMVTRIYDNALSIAFKGKSIPSGMYISDLNFKASITFEDTNEFPLAWITRFEMHQYDAIKDFGGWGERFGSRKRGTEDLKAYTAGGKEAILLTLTSGKKILVGTKNAQSFLQALQSALKKSS